jgi:hypothetical protein
MSLYVQTLLVASCRFGDTVHPPVNCDYFACPVSYLIRTDTVIVHLLFVQLLSLSLCLRRSRSGGVLPHSGHFDDVVFACNPCWSPRSSLRFVFGQAPTWSQLFDTCVLLPVLSLSKRAVISLVIGHLWHPARGTHRSQHKSLVILVKLACCTEKVNNSSKDDLFKEGCKSKDMHTLLCDDWTCEFVRDLGQVQRSSLGLAQGHRKQR